LDLDLDLGLAMGTKAKEMGALAVSRIDRRGANFVGGVAGLAINVTSTGNKSWIFRYQRGGRRRDLGLGGYPDVTLAAAREAARQARALLAQGIDPIEDARRKRSALLAQRATTVTFAEAAESYVKAHEAGWRNAKHAQQWRNTIAKYANPVLGKLFVGDVTAAHVLSVLEPIWSDKTETASRLRNRIELILASATARGQRTGPNPAAWKGHLDKLLPPPSRVARTRHHPALPYAEAPAFMARLREQPGAGARALEFAILTAARSGEVRGARWEEFDEEAATWVVPASRMKAGREHRVPLSPAAVQVLRAQREVATSDWVFPGLKEGPLSDMTLSAVLRRMGVPAVPHGFRSTFRDWCAEQTHYPNEVAEMALAHTVADKVEAAYRRGDLLDKRRQLMGDWASFLQEA
jgi:integrase